MYNDFEVQSPGNGNLKPEVAVDPKDWKMGDVPRPRPIIMPRNNPLGGRGSLKFLPSNDYQNFFDGEDSNGCVSWATGDSVEGYGNLLKSTDKDLDAFLHQIGMIDTEGSMKVNNRIVTVGSGTDPDSGNTVTAPAEFVRINGFSPQSAWPWDRSFTKKQFFSGLTQQIIDTGKPFLTRLGVEHEWVPTKAPSNRVHAPEQLVAALEIAFPTVSVDGRYIKDADGLITSAFIEDMKLGKEYAYGHRVTLGGYDENMNWIVKDHYNNQVLTFRSDYPFANAKNFYLLKKKTMNNLYKKIGQAAIGLYVPDNGGIVLFADGVDKNGKPVVGGSYFKAAGWTYSMAQPCSDWPYPIIGRATVLPETI